MKLIFTLAAAAVFNYSPLNANGITAGSTTTTKYTWGLSLLNHLPSQYFASATSSNIVPAQVIIHYNWLLNFTATKVRNKVQLKWTIGENEKASQFEIQKSNDDGIFSTLVVLPATERTGIEAYSFTDKNPMMKNGYFRLKLVNKDGSFAYSGIIHLNSESAANRLRHL